MKDCETYDWNFICFTEYPCFFSNQLRGYYSEILIWCQLALTLFLGTISFWKPVFIHNTHRYFSYSKVRWMD